MSPLSAEARAYLAASQDYSALARVSSRADFVAGCPFAFLFCPREILSAAAPGRTTMSPIITEAVLQEARPLLYAVRKEQSAFPSMITIGRTGNNDIVLNDWSVSRFHAYFAIGSDGGLLLTDAGSKNGTFVDDRRLEPGEPPVPLSLGCRVGVGRIAFVLVDAGTCWDVLSSR